jgi:hypothetical protein
LLCKAKKHSHKSYEIMPVSLGKLSDESSV